MATVTQNVVVIAIAILLSLIARTWLNRLWPRQQRRERNELLGWQLAVLGTTYAVILGFMLVTVWDKLGEADRNVVLEADAVVNIYRLADGLPETQRTQLKTLARSYADTVIHLEWPQMVAGQVPSKSSANRNEMWRTVMSVRGAAPTEVNAQERAMRELESLSEHRLIRILETKDRLPTVLWFVLLVGGAVTILSACAFTSENETFEALQVVCLSLLLSLSLVAIADIHRPFYGLIHVKDTAFQRAQENMESP